MGSGHALAPAGLRLPVVPRARRRAPPRRRPGATSSASSAASTTAAGTRASTTSTSTRSSSARTPCTRPATRWAWSATGWSARATRAATPPSSLLRRRRDLAGRHERGPGLRGGQQRAAGASSARTTSGRSRSPRRASPRFRSPTAATGFGIPNVRVDGNDVLACYAVTARGARAGALRAAAPASSRRSPTGWARTPRPTTRPATAPRRRRSTGRSATRSTALEAYLERSARWPTSSSPSSTPTPTHSATGAVGGRAWARPREVDVRRRLRQPHAIVATRVVAEPTRPSTPIARGSSATSASFDRAEGRH